MENAKILKKNPEMTTRVFDGETILIPLYASSRDADSIYVLDGVGTKIWGLIDGKRNISQIESSLLEEYEASPGRVRQSTTVFIKDLQKIKAVI